MKTLTIKQPWASLVCTPRPDNILLGIKDIENRTWRTDYRGRIGVHASGKPAFPISESILQLTVDQWRAVPQMLQDQFYYNYDTVPLSAIIGEVDIIDCVQNHPSIWAMPDHWNWVLANPVLYDEPILNVKGKLSFWEYRP